MTTPKPTTAGSHLAHVGHQPGGRYGFSRECASAEAAVSQATKEKADSIKLYIENKYSKMQQEEKAKKEGKLATISGSMGTSQAGDEQGRSQSFRAGAYKEAGAAPRGCNQPRGVRFVISFILVACRRTKMSIRDFLPLKIIGKGAFGEVRLVKSKKKGEILAMKKMKKSEMVAKHQVQHIKAEKDVLAMAQNPWIVELRYSFQDEKFLYLVMEYLPGGDLMTLLIKKEILSEEDSRFYIAEIVLGVSRPA